MKKLLTNFGERSYPIYYGIDLIKKIDRMLKEHKIGNNILIVSEPFIKKKYQKNIENSLQKNNCKISWYSIPSGERNKNLETIENLYKKCVESKIDKSSCIIAFGGGVIQDITCYLSATFRRGIPFVQIPTTLLSQVDIGIGGCAIDHPSGKSLIGTFYQPKLVITDLNLLKTLPQKEFSNGISEIINKVICMDGKKLNEIENDILKIKNKNFDTLEEYIILSNKSKLKIIEKDETGLTDHRLLLDFGHTITYALEKVMNYKISHGTALAIGMHGAALMSYEKNKLQPEKLKKLKKIIKKAELPIKIPIDIKIEQLINLMYFDQKIKKGKIRFVLMKNFGDLYISNPINEHEIKECFKKLY
jgi:3-dehydroquinate synthase